MEDIRAVTGPVDVLQEYEDQMTLISQQLSAEVAIIAQAVRNGPIKRAEAEYLMQQRSQLAVIQYQVFNALHDSLAFEVARTDSAVVAQSPCWKPCSSTTSRSQ